MEKITFKRRFQIVKNYSFEQKNVYLTQVKNPVTEVIEKSQNAFGIKILNDRYIKSNF